MESTRLPGTGDRDVEVPAADVPAVSDGGADAAEEAELEKVVKVAWGEAILTKTPKLALLKRGCGNRAH